MHTTSNTSIDVPNHIITFRVQMPKKKKTNRQTNIQTNKYKTEK